ncbi:MAG: GGDEF domain-containing protein [Burkholderiaceae bacterium]
MEPKNLERELQRLATTDMLTGLANRRAFLERAQLALQHHQASGDPLALLMLDIDHFKSINDRFGHLEGDQVLGLFARTLQTLLPPEGLAGRLGGEEFSVLLPGLGMPEARAVAQALLGAVRAMDLSSAPAVLHSGRRLTVSIGLACARAEDRSLHDLMDRADQALYLAKHRGRDQIASLQDQAAPPDNGLPNARTA